jgi:hypothetical protein
MRVFVILIAIAAIAIGLASIFLRSVSRELEKDDQKRNERYGDWGK